MKAADELLAHYEKRYVESRNPLEAWMAYYVVRTFGVSMPEWLLGYLDRACAGLLGAEVPPLAARPAFVAEQLGFKRHRRGQRTDEFDGFPASQAELIEGEVRRLRSAGMKASAARAIVVKARGVSESVVDRALTLVKGSTKQRR